MELILIFGLTQILLIASLTTQKTSDVFHHYGSFPGYYKKYRMSLTPKTERTEEMVHPFGKFYTADGSKYFIIK